MTRAQHSKRKTSGSRRAVWYPCLFNSPITRADSAVHSLFQAHTEDVRTLPKPDVRDTLMKAMRGTPRRIVTRRMMSLLDNPSDIHKVTNRFVKPPDSCEEGANVKSSQSKRVVTGSHTTRIPSSCTPVDDFKEEMVSNSGVNNDSISGAKFQDHSEDTCSLKKSEVTNLAMQMIRSTLQRIMAWRMMYQLENSSDILASSVNKHTSIKLPDINYCVKEEHPKVSQSKVLVTASQITRSPSFCQPVEDFQEDMVGNNEDNFSMVKNNSISGTKFQDHIEDVQSLHKSEVTNIVMQAISGTLQRIVAWRMMPQLENSSEIHTGSVIKLPEINYDEKGAKVFQSKVKKVSNSKEVVTASQMNRSPSFFTRVDEFQEIVSNAAVRNVELPYWVDNELRKIDGKTEDNAWEVKKKIVSRRKLSFECNKKSKEYENVSPILQQGNINHLSNIEVHSQQFSWRSLYIFVIRLLKKFSVV